MLRPLLPFTRGPFALAVVVGVLSPLLAGCETSVVIDPPPLEEALVVYSFPQPDSVWAVRVGRTLPLGTFNNGDPTLGEIRDATVRLYQDGALLDDLVFRPGQPPCEGCFPQAGRYVSPRGLRPEAGRTYRLEVTAPGLPMASAETTIPDAPAVEVLRNEWGNSTPFPGGVERQRELQVALTDPLGDDVYELAVLRRERDESCPNTLCSEFPASFQSPSPSFRDGYELLDVDVALDENRYFGTAVFRDDLFEGRRQTFDLRVYTYTPDEPGPTTVEYALLVARVSEPFARYQKALQQQELNQENPFAEPSPLYSNVTGGHGVVGGLAPLRLVLPDPSDD